MSEYVNSFIRQHSEYFARNATQIQNNRWDNLKNYEDTLDKFTNEILDLKEGEDSAQKAKKLKELEKEVRTFVEASKKTKDALFKSENKLTNSILFRLVAFITDASSDRGLPKTEKFIQETVAIIETHLKKCKDYLNYTAEKIGEKEIETDDEIEFNQIEVLFQDTVFNERIKIENVLSSLNINNSSDNLQIKFHNNKKAPLVMREPLCLSNEDVKIKTESLSIEWNISTSKEMFINMNPKYVPRWDTKKHFFEQDKVSIQFWTEEYNKIKNGVTIGGYKMHGWMYFHLNFFRTPLPQKDGSEPNVQPGLRDNEWFFAENLNSCISKEYPDYYSRAMLIYGTRRFGKSVILASLAHWRSLTKFNSFGSIIGGNSSDINALTSKVKTSMMYIDSPFRLEIIKQNWDNGETTFGIKEDASNAKVFSTLIVQNLEAGTTKKTQVTAGLAPSVSIYDEIGKYSFLKPYLAALPSFKTPYGFKCITVLAGCVCAGTKVWNNLGELVNIEDLDKEDGILGFDLESEKISKEAISYWQKPHIKPCYRIETNTGRYLECSDDHPILFRSRNETFGKRTNRQKKMYFKEAKDLEVGCQIAVVESIPVFGNKNMWNPRLVGLLIGDGSYGFDSNPILSNCDDEVNNYLYENFDAIKESGYVTKDGRDYKESRIRGICPQLRDLGIYGQTKDKKTFPTNIGQYTENDLCELIGGFFDADGSVQCTDRNSNIQITSAYKNLLLELKLQLQKLGIHGGILFCKPNLNNPKDKNGWYRMTISDKRSVLAFHNKIKFLIGYKQANLEKAVDNLKEKKCKIPKDVNNLRFERVTSVEYIGEKPVYNLTAENTHTYIANGIITHNTGGEADLSQDAMDVLANPVSYDLLPMNWDLLETNIDPEFITWERKPFATFFPGQMAYEEGFIKKDVKFSTFLGKENKELSKINIGITNWKKNTDYLVTKADEAKKSNGAKGQLLQQQIKVQYPLRTDDCFLSAEKNIFNSEEARKRKEYLEQTGQWDRRFRLSKNYDGTIAKENSNDKLAEYPHRGGNIDSPFLIFEDFPNYKAPINTYILGLDDYKQDDSGTDSVGTAYVYKYDLFGDAWAFRLVASYASRPEKHSDFHKNVLMLAEAYNAQIFMENEDTAFVTYLETRHLADQYLIPHIDFTSKLEYTVNGRRKVGFTPAQSKRKLLNMYASHLKEDYKVINEEGLEISMDRTHGINDIGLLSELINYKPDNNVDRITASMAAVGYIYYLIANHIHPKRYIKQDLYKKPIERNRNPYSLNNIRQKNPYSRRN